MRGEDIDRILSRNDKMVPSSSFTASVMEAVTREATAPSPIPFPWKRALPGLSWCLAVSIAFLTTGPNLSERLSLNPPPISGTLDLSVVLGGAVWISTALAASLLSIGISMRLTRRV
jgi:hypothetical protein